MLETKTAPVELATDQLISCKGYAAQDADSSLSPWSFERRAVGAHDILIEIRYCGVCHTDIHFLENDLGVTVYPIIPGHDIVGVASSRLRDIYWYFVKAYLASGVLFCFREIRFVLPTRRSTAW